MRTVCFLVTYLGSGGAENYLLRYIQHEKSIRPIVICKGMTKGVLEDDYLAANATIFTIPSGYFNVVSWFRAYKIFKKYQPDAMCDFTGNFAGIFIVLAKLAGVKKRIAFYRRSSDAFKPSFLNKSYDKFVNKLVARFGTNILANSQTGLDYFHPCKHGTDSRFQVIYNGLDEEKFVSDVSREAMRDELGIPQEAFVVGHSGRLNVAKNHPTMLKVAERLVEKHPNIYFLFCGKDTEQLLEQTTSVRLKERLVLLGYRSDVNRVLKALDLYFFPSITEGQPNALIEAMITGVPFVASNIGAIKEVVPPQMSNYIFDPYDISGFEEKIESLYLKRYDLGKLSCSDYAIKQFKAETNFSKLTELL